MATSTLIVTMGIRHYWLLKLINFIPVYLGFKPFVPKWFIVTNLEKKS